MPFGWVIDQVTGNTAGARNNARRRAENEAFKAAKEQWRIENNRQRDQHEFAEENYLNQVKQAEENLRFQEIGLIDSFESQKEMRDFEFDMANRAYDKSVSQASGQKEFNRMAFDVANQEQDVKRKEDLLGVLFDESQTVLDYKANSTGLQMNKMNELIQADFKDAKITSKMAFDMGSLAIDRRKARSESQIETQKSILAGMKAAGELRARGNGGRSSAKSVLGVMAESGAIQASIANGLMYAEQAMDLGVAQLQDMFILDQTMVVSARDKAINDASFAQSKLDSTNRLDREKIAATRESIRNRDAVVRKQIINARKQSDLNAEAAILLKPERLPALSDPRDLYAEYDNPETEDYVELFFRPDVVDFPEYIDLREPERDDFRGERENVLATNIGGAVGLAGLVAGGIGGFVAPSTNFLGMSGGTWSTIGKTLGGFGGYPR